MHNNDRFFTAIRILKLNMRNLILCCAVLISACTDPINFDTGSEQQFLIIDGFITNEPGPYEIRLYRSASFTSVFEGGQEMPIVGANVWIRDDQGLYINLVDNRNGGYLTPVGFRGEVGRTYTLHIITPEGEEYQSTREKILIPEQISNARFEYGATEVLNSQNRITEIFGLFYIIDSEFEQESGYYRWDWEGTYIKETTFFDGSTLDFCYIDERASDHVLILDATQSGEGGIFDHLVVFHQVDIRYNFGYNINLRQYTISEDSYNYWKLIDQQRNRQGSIFDVSPANIAGNIINVNNADEIILGRFEAYGASSIRLGVFPDALPFKPQFRDGSCFPLSPLGEPPPYCFDCALFPGSRPLRPDFWVD